MKSKFTRLMLALVVLCGFAHAQTNRFPPINTYDGDPSGVACGIPNELVQSTTIGAIYSCIGGIYVSSGGTSYPGVASNGALGLTVSGAFVAAAIQDSGSRTINAADVFGTDPGSQISNAFATICQGANCNTNGAGIVDACHLSLSGNLDITSDPFASIRTARSNFSGVLKLCGAHLRVANNLLPLVIPGGVTIDGGSTHALPSPTYPANVGTTIQPATAGYKGVVLAMGDATDNFNPMGVGIQRLAIGCLAPGETYATTTGSITSWATSGGTAPYTGIFQAPNTLSAGDVISLSGFGTTTAFNGNAGQRLVVLSTGLSASQFEVLIDVAPSSATEAGTFTVGRNTWAVLNANSQEGSMVGPNVFISGCQGGLDWETDPANGVTGHFSSDSTGADRVFMTLPADPNAIGIQVGGSPNGFTSGTTPNTVNNIAMFKDITIQGTLIGVAPGAAVTGACVEVEASNVVFMSIRCAYINTQVEMARLISSHENTFINVSDVFSNNNNAAQTLFWYGPKAGQNNAIIDSSLMGTYSSTATTLYDANYPGGGCTLLAATESSIGHYVRGDGIGNPTVLSTVQSTNPCRSTAPTNFAKTDVSNTFLGTTILENTVHVSPLTAATGGGNVGSPTLAVDGNYWNGSASVTLSHTLQCTPGSGATPNFTCNFAPPATAPALRVLTLATGGAVPWDIIDFGASATTTTNRIRGNIQMFNLAGTFHADFPQPTLTGTRTYTLQDASGTLPLTIVSGTATLGTGAITAGTCATAVTVTATNAVTTDSIEWVFNGAPGSGWPSLHIEPYMASGQVNFLVCNASAGSVTPAAATLNWRVIR